MGRVESETVGDRPPEGQLGSSPASKDGFAGNVKMGDGVQWDRWGQSSAKSLCW